MGTEADVDPDKLSNMAQLTAVALCSAALSQDGDAFEMIIKYYKEDVLECGFDETKADFFISSFLAGTVVGLTVNLDEALDIEEGSTFQNWADRVNAESN